MFYYYIFNYFFFFFVNKTFEPKPLVRNEISSKHCATLCPIRVIVIYLAVVSGSVVGHGARGRRARGRLHVFLIAHRFVFYRHRIVFDADHLDVAGAVALVERQLASAVLAAVLVQVWKTMHTRSVNKCEHKR